MRIKSPVIKVRTALYLDYKLYFSQIIGERLRSRMIAFAQTVSRQSYQNDEIKCQTPAIQNFSTRLDPIQIELGPGPRKDDVRYRRATSSPVLDGAIGGRELDDESSLSRATDSSSVFAAGSGDGWADASRDSSWQGAPLVASLPALAGAPTPP